MRLCCSLTCIALVLLLAGCDDPVPDYRPYAKALRRRCAMLESQLAASRETQTAMGISLIVLGGSLAVAIYHIHRLKNRETNHRAKKP